jgi:hypothetical protein
MNPTKKSSSSSNRNADQSAPAGKRPARSASPPAASDESGDGFVEARVSAVLDPRQALLPSHPDAVDELDDASAEADSGQSPDDADLPPSVALATQWVQALQRRQWIRALRVLSCASPSAHPAVLEVPLADLQALAAQRFQVEYAWPAQSLPAESGYLRGHGTLERAIPSTSSTSSDRLGSDLASMVRAHDWSTSGGAAASLQLISTVSGQVERVNKLISVRPLRQRYRGEVGDVVVGRVVEVAQRLWRLECSSRQEAVLMLSAIDLPGGILVSRDR